MHMRILSVLALTVLVGCLGCGHGDGKFLLEGTATWNGEPIADGDLELQPADGKGQIDGAEIKNGRFKLLTSAGPKKVSVFARKQVGMTEPTERIPNPEPIQHQFLPLKFNDRTEIEREVKSGEKLALEFTGEELPYGAVSPAEQARQAAQGGQAN